MEPQIPRRLRRFRILSLATTVVTLALVAAGGLVRATGSGLGCLDEWPRCRGGWTAPADLQGIIEYGHRLLALVAIALVVVLALTARKAPVRASVRRWAYAAVPPFLLQALIGAAVVFRHLHSVLVTLHLLTAMLLVYAVVRVFAEVWIGRHPVTPTWRRAALATLAAVALVLVAGALVREKGAGLAFEGWPLMDGQVIPQIGSIPDAAHFVHRILAFVVGIGLVVVAVRAPRALRALALLTVGLYAGQALVGAANVWSGLAPAAVLGHVAIGALVWASASAMSTTVAPATGAAPGSQRPRGRLHTIVAAYVQLMKPRIIVLLLVTTVPTMVIADRGMPPFWLIAATLLGGTLAAGGANAINQYLDRDIDSKMDRTRGRPLPTHRVAPRRALVFGVVLGLTAFVFLTLTVNLLSALLAEAALLFYVLVYTLWMKRSTPQNIVIGGAAGAVPVLVGWAAVTGRVGVEAWLLFAIVFVWTPPHFWALSMKYTEDYAEAGVPMLPVVRGFASTTRQILGYTFVLVAVTLAFQPVGRMGLLYLLSAVALGLGFIYQAERLRRKPTADGGMRVFRYSVNYLALLFAAMAADALLGSPH